MSKYIEKPNMDKSSFKGIDFSLVPKEQKSAPAHKIKVLGGTAKSDSDKSAESNQNPNQPQKEYAVEESTRAYIGRILMENFNTADLSTVIKILGIDGIPTENGLPNIARLKLEIAKYKNALEKTDDTAQEKKEKQQAEEDERLRSIEVKQQAEAVNEETESSEISTDEERKSSKRNYDLDIIDFGLPNPLDEEDIREINETLGVNISPTKPKCPSKGPNRDDL